MAGVRSEPRPINERKTMQNLPYIIGLIILSLLTVGLIWKIMPCVIGILALV
jgi:hypothetical protein